MRKRFSIKAKLGIAAIVLIILLGAAVGYLALVLPQVGKPSNIHVESTPARLERGKYLVEHVAACLDCHSPADESKMFHHPMEGREGAGGRSFPGPGRIYSSNLTPAYLGDWSDGQVLRAFTAGVTKDGQALFPMMPYLSYGTMDQEDALSIIAYIRTLKPIQSVAPKTHLQFVPSLFINLAPRPARFSSIPPQTDVVAYGRYLTTMASCIDCHSPRDAHGQMLKGLQFAGGMAFPLATGGVVRSVNITPDMESGIGKWTRTDFVQKFKSFDNHASRMTASVDNQFHSVMPWISYGGMTKSDLGAIYQYLRTLAPISHRVVRFEAGH